MALRTENLKGRIFGRLVALKHLGPYTRSSWMCRCECGKTAKVRGFFLKHGLTKSCGCVRLDLTTPKARHGHAGKRTKTAEYRIYIGIIRRCTNTTTDRSKDYVGRGIKICQRWRHGENGQSGFECFLADMGRRPSTLHSIDRKDNDGDYEPNNCRWATKVEQGRNRRSNRRIMFRGESITMTEATMVAFVSADAIRERIHKGWSVDAAVSTPPTNTGRKKVQLPSFGTQRSFSDDSIRGFVANRWSPDCDPEAIWREANARLGADRDYVKKTCREFGERRNLVMARTSIVIAIATRWKK